MNYTENYHLPQWVKTDRIMMEDFNQMCANIETGLNQSEQAAGKSWDRLRRLAYNHYNALLNIEPAPWQVGLFQQNPAKDPSGIGGTEAYWEGIRFAGKNSAPLTQESLSAGIQTNARMMVYRNQPEQCTSASVVFLPPATGIIRNFALQGRYTNCTLNDTFRFRLTMINQATGKVEKTLTEQFTYSSNNVSFNILFNHSIAFTGGTSYLITLEPLTATCDMNATFAVVPETVITTASNNTGIITAEHTFQEQSAGMGGMAVVHGLAGCAGGTMTLLWDGTERTPDVTRSIRAKDGRDIQEWVYLRTDQVPADSQISFRFESAMDGFFLFYDWGAMLF